MSDLPRAGAYIHVPYCAHRCTYCSFVAVTGTETEAAYFAAVEREATLRSGEVRGPLDTVYFGGGTPSFVPPERLARLLEHLSDVWGLADGSEVTAEANPDDLGPERLASLARAGVSRLSVGVQSLDDGELVHLERRHDAGSARRALAGAASLFGRVSADLMIGVPGQTRESLLASLEGVLGAGVTHVSVYLLELEKAPRLLSLREASPGLFAGDDELADRWEAVDDACAASGLRRYEVSSWAVPGHESRHNLKYWTLVPTIGLGVAAHSWDGSLRRASTGSLTEYLRRLAGGLDPVVASERVDGDVLARERVLLGLRLGDGVSPETFRAARETLGADARERLEDAFAAGALESPGGQVRLTRRGVLVSNEVFALFV